MTTDTDTPQPAGSLREILKTLLAKSVVQSVTPTTTITLVNEAEAAITALIEGAAPAAKSVDWQDMGTSELIAKQSNAYGFNQGVENYRANLLRALNGKGQNE